MVSAQRQELRNQVTSKGRHTTEVRCLHLWLLLFQSETEYPYGHHSSIVVLLQNSEQVLFVICIKYCSSQKKNIVLGTMSFKKVSFKGHLKFGLVKLQQPLCFSPMNTQLNVKIPKLYKNYGR